MDMDRVLSNQLEIIKQTIVTGDYAETANGFCDICGTQEFGIVEELKKDGWYLGGNEHFCPVCNLD